MSSLQQSHNKKKPSVFKHKLSNGEYITATPINNTHDKSGHLESDDVIRKLNKILDEYISKHSE